MDSIARQGGTNALFFWLVSDTRRRVDRRLSRSTASPPFLALRGRSGRTALSSGKDCDSSLRTRRLFPFEEESACSCIATGSRSESFTNPPFISSWSQPDESFTATARTTRNKSALALRSEGSRVQLWPDPFRSGFGRPRVEPCARTAASLGYAIVGIRGGPDRPKIPSCRRLSLGSRLLTADGVWKCRRRRAQGYERGTRMRGIQARSVCSSLGRVRSGRRWDVREVGAASKVSSKRRHSVFRAPAFLPFSRFLELSRARSGQGVGGRRSRITVSRPRGPLECNSR